MVFDYDRQKAVAYADRWAYFRNPAYYNCEEIGGDCTNFASQCLYAGSGVMNYTPVTGWYYISANDRTASWTGVEYFYNFVVNNKGPGPFGHEVGAGEVQPGDFVQINFTQPFFEHTPVIVSTGARPGINNIRVAAHTIDSNCRPLTSYHWQSIRFIHIDGVRTSES